MSVRSDMKAAAERARRLAAEAYDLRLRDELLALATQYDAQAAAAEADPEPDR